MPSCLFPLFKQLEQYRWYSLLPILLAVVCEYADVCALGTDTQQE